MGFFRRRPNWFYLLTLSFLFCLPLFAAGQEFSRTYPWTWRSETCWSNGWWIFPVLFFVLVIALCFRLMHRGGMACFPRNRTSSGPGFFEAIRRDEGDQALSALELLNRRYAQGEIDKQEYEEKKTGILSSRQSGL